MRWQLLIFTAAGMLAGALALPRAWTLFLIAMLGGAAVGMVRGRGRGWLSGVLTFFVHDQ